MIVHQVASARYGAKIFEQRVVASWLWRRLSVNRSKLYSLVLMPDHVHLIHEVEHEQESQEYLSRQLHWLARQFKLKTSLFSIPLAEQIPNTHHLRRQIRYVHLNPCRANLTRDPLSWEWSTHRDWVGLTLDAVISEEVRKSVFDRFSAEHFHSYVSQDPSCRVEGTLLPKNEQYQFGSLSRLLAVIATSSRVEIADLASQKKLRQLCVQTAVELGWSQSSAQLQKILRVTDRTLRRLKANPKMPQDMKVVFAQMEDDRMVCPRRLSDMRTILSS